MLSIIIVEPYSGMYAPVRVAVDFTLPFTTWRDGFVYQLRESPWLKNRTPGTRMMVFLDKLKAAKNEDEFEELMNDAPEKFHLERGAT